MSLPTSDEILKGRCGKCGERFRADEGIVMYIHTRGLKISLKLAHVHHFFPTHTDSDHMGLGLFQ